MIFVYEWKLQWLPSAKDKVHVLYIQKAKQIAKQFIYTKKIDTLKKQEICVMFYIQETKHFKACNLSWNYLSWHLCTKSMTLCVTWRFIKKPDTSQEARQFELRFYMKKNGHFALRNFHKNVEIGQGEGGISIWKNHAICVTFL